MAHVPGTKTSKLRLGLAAALLFLSSCQNSTGSSEVTNPFSPVAVPRILDDVGGPIAGAKIVSIASGLATTTDSTGSWTPPGSRSGHVDTFRLLIDSLSAGTILLPASGTLPPDVHVAWHQVGGPVSYDVSGSSVDGIRLVVVRRSGDRDSVRVAIDSATQTYGARFPNIEGDSSEFGTVYAEIFDGQGAVARSDTLHFDKQPLQLSLPLYYTRSLVIDVYLSASWRYRDTSRVYATGIDTTILARMEWSTSLDSVWRQGSLSLPVKAPSGNDPPLLVRARATSREGRVDLQEIAFRPGPVSQSGTGDAIRIPTPPRMTVSVPPSRILGDTFTLATKAWDTLGGTVVQRKVAWNSGDTVNVASDLEVLRLPTMKVQGNIGGNVIAIDNDGETTFVFISIRPIQPAPVMTISEKTTRSFRVSWDSALVESENKFHVHVRDGIDDSLLIDTLVDAGPGSIVLPRRFLARDLQFEGRFEGASADSGLWAEVHDSIPSGPLNPYWIRVYPDYLYMWLWSAPNETEHYFNGQMFAFPPHSDTTQLAFYGSTPDSSAAINGSYYYPNVIGWSQAPHIQDSIILDIEAVDSVVVSVIGTTAPSSPAAGAVVGWSARKVGSGKQVFRTSDLDLPGSADSSGGWSTGSRIAAFRDATGLDISFACAQADSVCNSKATAVLLPSVEFR